MSTEPSPTISAIPTKHELDVLTRLANVVMQARVQLPKNCSTPQAVLMKFLIGRELHMSPLAALYEIDVYDGKAAMNARTMAALVRSRGLGVIEHVSSNDEEAVVRAIRADDPQKEHIFNYTMNMADRAGLASKKNWKANPEAMLLARATSRAAKAIFPDVFQGCAYTPDELTDGDYDPGEKVEFADTIAASGITLAPGAMGEPMTIEQAEEVANIISSQTAGQDANAPPPQDETLYTQIKTITDKANSIIDSMPIPKPSVIECLKRVAPPGLVPKSLEKAQFALQHVLLLANLCAIRDVLKIKPEQWQAALRRRGVTSALNLAHKQAKEMHDLLYEKLTPFDRQGLPSSMLEVISKHDSTSGKEVTQPESLAGKQSTAGLSPLQTSSARFADNSHQDNVPY